MLNYGAPSSFYEESTEFAKSAMAFLLSSQFHVCGCECYIAESVASWEKESGSVVKIAYNIRLGYCTILTVK